MLRTAKVGGLGGFDYIYADNTGRRLYIPRGAVQGATPQGRGGGRGPMLPDSFSILVVGK